MADSDHDPDIGAETIDHPSRPASISYFDQTNSISPGADGKPLSPTDPDTRARAQHGKPLPAIPGFDLVAEVGRGGMGVIYRAHQLDLNRPVAIKMVIADRFDRPEDLIRFRMEAELLARIRHPNVVQVYDSGAHDGQPYLVLEWVEGGTLGQFLKGSPQPPEVGARTVELLARAIHVAHCNGVIHRDLKPSNVLVVLGGESVNTQVSSVDRMDSLRVTLSVDGQPVPLMPKIADFGLAKQLVGATHMTETGKIMGTPDYMSPEQAAGRSDLTGPATDVYSLGVILYQMITGRTPFQNETSTPLHAHLSRVIQEEPRRPSLIQPRLPKDLETICMKCLEKEPTRRYSTASALADDLENYAQGRPISARPTGSLERLWKWARRRPAVAGLGLVAGLFLFLGVLGITWQWRAAVAERDRAEKAERDVLGEKANSDAVNQFLVDDLFSFPDFPDIALGKDLKAADLLKKASATIDQRHGDRPMVAASLHIALGNSFRKLGLYEESKKHLTAGVKLRREQLGESHRDVLKAESDLGLLLADMHQEQAVQLLRRITRDSEARFGTDDPLTLEANGRLAGVLRDRGEMAEAETLFRNTLAATRRVLGPADLRTLAVVNDFGVYLHKARRISEAEAAFREAADGRSNALAPAHPLALESFHNLAAVLDEECKWDEARTLYERVLDDKRRVLGPEHIDTNLTMNNFALQLDKHGDPEGKAEGLLVQAHQGLKAALGAVHPTTLKVRNNLGQHLFRLGKVKDAAIIFEEVFAMRGGFQNADQPGTLESMNDLGAVKYALQQTDEAETYFKRALDGRRKVLGKGHPDTLQTEFNDAKLKIRQRKFTQAAEQCQSALEAAVKAGNAESLIAISLLGLQVEALSNDQRTAEALAPAERAFALASKLPCDPGNESWRARRNLGVVLLELKRYSEAEPHLVGSYQNALTMPQLPKSAVEAAGRRVIRLYEEWNKPEKVAEWRKILN